MQMKTTDLPPANCPKCGNLIDKATSYEGMAPAPGDFTVCAVCGEMLRFTESLGLRLLIVPADIVEMQPGLFTQLQFYSKGIRRMRASLN